MQTGDIGLEIYAEDKPKDCVYCYFWEKAKQCCSLAQCHYLAGSQKKTVKAVTGEMPDCAGCPYGRYSRCIGYCLQKIMQGNELKNRQTHTGVACL